MILIRFGVPGKYWLPRLCPATCAYFFSQIEYENTLNCTIQELDEFEKSCKQNDTSVVIARNLRVSSFDADGIVSNRYAHTYILLTHERKKYTREEQWYMFHCNLKAIAFLYGQTHISRDIVHRIERIVWRNCGDLRSVFLRYTRRLLNFIIPQLAEKMLAPDYEWRTGANAGRTTISVLAERWNHRMLSMY